MLLCQEKESIQFFEILVNSMKYFQLRNVCFSFIQLWFIMKILETVKVCLDRSSYHFETLWFIKEGSICIEILHIDEERERKKTDTK